MKKIDLKINIKSENCKVILLWKKETGGRKRMWDIDEVISELTNKEKDDISK